MSFKAKIDNILNSNKLGVNSVYALEKIIKASTGSVNKYYQKDKEPGVGTIKKIKKTFNLSDAEWNGMSSASEPSVQYQRSREFVPMHVLDHYRNTAEHIMQENKNLWEIVKKNLKLDVVNKY
jgi:hypothetical protein